LYCTRLYLAALSPCASDYKVRALLAPEPQKSPILSCLASPRTIQSTPSNPTPPPPLQPKQENCQTKKKKRRKEKKRKGGETPTVFLFIRYRDPFFPLFAPHRRRRAACCMCKDYAGGGCCCMHESWKIKGKKAQRGREGTKGDYEMCQKL